MFRAIGLVIGLIAVRVFLPDLFNAFEHAAVAFFNLVEQVFTHAPNSVIQSGVASAGSVLDGANYVPSPAPLPAYLSSY